MNSPESADTKTSKKWVKFEEDVKSNENGATSAVITTTTAGNTPAVIESHSVQLNVVSSQKDGTNYTTSSSNNHLSPIVAGGGAIRKNVNNPRSADQIDASDSHIINMRNVDLRDNANGVNSSVSQNVLRQGFANGDVIVTLLPINTSFPWVTPATFRPELVPEELMAHGLTLTVEDYVHVMEMLTNDVRFTLYNVCYKRVLVLWIFTAFCVLLALLVSGVQGLTLFTLGVLWLVFNVGAIFLCMWIKIKLNQNLERCLAQINRNLIRHKIILGLDDRGRLSCHKVNLCFVFFDTTDCVKKLQEVVEREEAEGRILSREPSKEERKAQKQFQERMDIDDQDIIIQGANPSRLSRKQERGEQLFVRYIQRWSKDYLRRRLDWTVDEEGGNPLDPRHLASALCPCQYIEEYLRYKPRVDRRAFCPCFSAYLRERGID